MPCNDPSDDLRALELKKRLDLVTALLCKCCENLERENLSMSHELAEWWEVHKEADQKRENLKERERD